MSRVGGGTLRPLGLRALACCGGLLCGFGLFARALPARAKRIGKNIDPQTIVGFAAHHITKGIGVGKKINAVGRQIDRF